jgi:hypothetical protein
LFVHVRIESLLILPLINDHDIAFPSSRVAYQCIRDSRPAVLVEVQNRLFRFIPNHCLPLIVVSQVSKLLYKIFNDTPRLQYNLELALSGMQHNRACDLPLHESLVAIRAYRTAWDTLNWSRSEKLTPPYPETQVVGGLITYINESAEIPLRTVRQVPSTLRSIQSQHWSFPSRNTPAGGYVLAIDVIQDLVVWSEVIVYERHDLIHIQKLTDIRSNAPLDIRVRTLSSNQPYFGVEVPVLIIPGGPGLSSVFEVDIVGSYLAVSGCCPAQAGENGGVILVCNWKQQQVTLVKLIVPLIHSFSSVPATASGRGFQLLRVP